MGLSPILGSRLPFYLIKERAPAIVMLSTAVFPAVRPQIPISRDNGRRLS